MLPAKADMITQLRRDILQMEGYRSQSVVDKELMGLGPIESAFPDNVFPLGAIHEFLSTRHECAAASAGFITGLLSTLMKKGGVCIWISAARKIFPPALKLFGVAPHKVIFIDVDRDKEVLWTTEEALKCGGLAAVVAEVRELTFMQSRRLQLAVETSKVTGFVLRTDPRRAGATACVARWQVTPIAGYMEHDMPGVGFPRWQVDLLKVRNGRPGSWQVHWAAGSFVMEREKNIDVNTEVVRKTG